MEKENAMDEDKNMKTITVTDNDVVGSDTRLVDVIAALTGLTDRALALEFIQNNPDANQYHPDIYTRQ
jgi:galactokinase